MKSSDAKASKRHLKFSSKIWIFFSGSYIYVQLFHFNGNEKNLFIANTIKLLNLHIKAWENMICLVIYV